jgi:hypothetical protein
MLPAARPAPLVLAALLAASCAPAVSPLKSQLEVRAFQTYTFENADGRLVMKAMLNTLQDDGYVVRNAVMELGLITATQEIDLAPGRSGRAGGDALGTFGGVIVIGPQPLPAFRKIEVRDFTGNVTEAGDRTQVRVSFQRKILDSRGHVVEVTVMDDPVFYQDFFSRMDKSVYLQRERL